MCPNCKSKNTWDDNSCWGCNKCGWCSLPGLNRSPTASSRNAIDMQKRAETWGYYEQKEYEKRVGLRPDWDEE